VSHLPPRALFAAALLAAPLSAFLSAPLGAAPGDEADPGRARVAAQCAAFWVGAGRPDRAAAFRALSETAGGDRAFTERFIERTRPAMERLSAERATSPRAALLWARHAALCGGAADDE
jgi:hypothetical protein